MAGEPDSGWEPMDPDEGSDNREAAEPQPNMDGQGQAGPIPMWISRMRGRLVRFVRRAPEEDEVPAEEEAAPAVPTGRLYAATYGPWAMAPWGSNSAARKPEKTKEGAVTDVLGLAQEYAETVKSWGVTDREVVPVVNLTVNYPGRMKREEIKKAEWEALELLVESAAASGTVVMIDLYVGMADPVALTARYADHFLPAGPHVWIDVDWEHCRTRNEENMTASALAYFQRRAALGYDEPGVFAGYVFASTDIALAGRVARRLEALGPEEYDRRAGAFVPLFDGFGSTPIKFKKTEMLRSEMGKRHPYGIMEFVTRWKDRYDKGFEPEEYLRAFPQTLLFIRQ
jgi:hypothetical protein